MVALFPHHYTASVIRTGPARADLEAPPRPTVRGGPPPEFGGIPETWSPEHLLLSAVGLCFETTFDTIATRDGLVVDSWRVRVDGVVDRTAAGVAFTSIAARIEITAAAELVERTRLLAARARHCHISSSLSVPVEVDVFVEATQPLRARVR